MMKYYHQNQNLSKREIFDYVIVRLVGTHNIHKSSTAVQILPSFRWGFSDHIHEGILLLPGVDHPE